MSNVKIMRQAKYERIVWTMKDYPGMKWELERLKANIGIGASKNDGMPRSTKVSSPVEDMAIKIADLEREIKQIEKAIATIPEEFREGILNNVIYGQRFPCNSWGFTVPNQRTWQREKQKFIVNCAKIMHIN